MKKGRSDMDFDDVDWARVWCVVLIGLVVLTATLGLIAIWTESGKLGATSAVTGGLAMFSGFAALITSDF